MILDNSQLPEGNVIPFMNRFDHISPSDLDHILETLDDLNYLNSEGKDFRHKLWEMFIKKADDKGDKNESIV